MVEEIKKTENAVIVPKVATAPTSAVGVPTEGVGNDRGRRSGPRPRRGGNKKGGDRGARPKPEFDNKMLDIRRVARVVAGGRRFNFSVALVAGNRKGQVGVGIGKAGDTALAIEKALRDAKKNMITVNTTKDMSIAHEVSAKYSSARVFISPSKDRGIVAGSAARTVIELAGMSNIVVKIISPSKNKLNIARATISALRGINLIKPTTIARK